MRRSLAGFTLIELLVVIAIIGMLASIVMASLNSARSKARDARRLADVNQLVNAFELYASDSALPSYGSAICLGVASGQTCWGASAVPGDSSLMSALQPYMPQIPADPSPNRGAGDRYLYFNGTIYNNNCGGVTDSGQYIFYQPETVSTGMNCGRGVLTCCSGVSCTATYYCAVKL